MTPRDKAVVVDGLEHVPRGHRFARAARAGSRLRGRALCSAVLLRQHQRRHPALPRTARRCVERRSVLLRQPAGDEDPTHSGRGLRLGARARAPHERQAHRSRSLEDRRVAYGWADRSRRQHPIIFRYLAAGVDGAIVIAPAVFPDIPAHLRSRPGRRDVRRVRDLCPGDPAVPARLRHRGRDRDDEGTARIRRDLRVVGGAPPLIPASEARTELLSLLRTTSVLRPGTRAFARRPDQASPGR